MCGHSCLYTFSGECLWPVLNGLCLCVHIHMVTSGRQPLELLPNGSKLSWTMVSCSEVGKAHMYQCALCSLLRVLHSCGCLHSLWPPCAASVPVLHSACPRHLARDLPYLALYSSDCACHWTSTGTSCGGEQPAWWIRECGYEG